MELDSGGVIKVRLFRCVFCDTRIDKSYIRASFRLDSKSKHVIFQNWNRQSGLEVRNMTK